MATSPNAISP